MKILLTGADGFTGRYFEDTALKAGHQIVALTADLTNKAALFDEVAAIAPDAVVHLAAISFVGHADASAFYTVNVIGTTNLLEALAALPVKPQKVLLASSANIYGNCDIGQAITEDQPPAPANHYAMSKLAMEHMAKLWMDKLPIVITRPFNYTGVGQAPQFLIPKIVDHFRRRAPVIELGNIEVERDFSDVRFVANAYCDLLQQDSRNQVFNICSGNVYALKDVLHMASEIAGYEIEVRVNPAFVRANEIRRLEGCNRRLMQVAKNLQSIALEDTLRWMLSASA